MRVTMFDYGAGNLHSLQKALAIAGADVRVQSDPLACLDGDALVLPGVGAFAPAAERLAPASAAIRDAVAHGFPLIGVCLGMQLLFDESDEGAGEGLGIIAGRVERLRARRVPQMGWNALENARDACVSRSELEWVYYANSFVARPRDALCVTAWSDVEGDRFPAVVRAGSAVGVQFHPEKSSAPGVAFLTALLEECVR